MKILKERNIKKTGNDVPAVATELQQSKSTKTSVKNGRPAVATTLLDNSSTTTKVNEENCEDIDFFLKERYAESEELSDQCIVKKN